MLITVGASQLHQVGHSVRHRSPATDHYFRDVLTAYRWFRTADQASLAEGHAAEHMGRAPG